MVIGVLNPSDSLHSPSVRPARTNTGVNQRRWFSNSMSTELRDQDLNDLLAQIRYAIDYYSVLDTEGDDSALQQAIATGAASLTGNIAQLQAIVGGANKVPYWTSGSAMGTFTATSYSRSLFAMTNQTQWRDALGISAIESDNLVAFGGLASSGNTIGYFTGSGTMALTPFTPAARGLLDDIDVGSMRVTLGIDSAALHPASDFATPSDLALKANIASPSLTGVPTTPTAATGNNTTQIASTAYVKSNIAALTTADIGGLSAALALKADLASPTLTGTPLSTTPGTTDNTTKIATTAYVKNNLASYAPLASPALTGVPTAPSATTGTNTTQIASTAFVNSSITTASANYQPLDTELTTLSTSTAFFLTLSDDANAATARTTLGLGSAATHPDTDFLVPADLIPYAPLASPALTGTPTAPTAANATNTTQIASTAYVKNNLASYAPLASPTFTGTLTADSLISFPSGATSTVGIKGDAGFRRELIGYTGSSQRWGIRLGDATAETGANVGSDFSMFRYNDAGTSLGMVLSIPRSTGIVDFNLSPTAPTPTAGDSTTKLATTAFVDTSYAPLASPVFTGNPTAPTQVAGSNNLRLATTAFVVTALGSYQPLDAELTALAGLVSAADRVPYFTGSGTAALGTLTTFGRSLIDDADAAAGRSTLGAAPSAATYLVRTADAGLSAELAVTDSTSITADWGTAGQVIFKRAALTGDVSSPADSNGLTLATVNADVGTYGSSTQVPQMTVNAKGLITSVSNLAIVLTSLAISDFAEAAQDTIGGMLDGSLVYVDATPLLTRGALIGDISAPQGSNSTTLATVNATTGVFGSATQVAQITVNGKGLITAATDVAITPAYTSLTGIPAAIDAIDGLVPAADQLPYYTGASTAALTTLSSFGRTLIDDTTAAAARTTLGVPNIAGDTFTGNLVLDRVGAASNASITIKSDTGTSRNILTQMGTALRWAMRLGDTSAESGSNAGSNFVLIRYDDAGTLLGTPISVIRSTGIVSFEGQPTVGGVQIAGQRPTSNKSASFTLAALEAGTNLFATAAGATNCTCPDNATLTLPIGFWAKITQYGAGQVTVIGGTGVTIRGPGNLVKTRVQYSTIEVYKRTATEWIVSGDVGA